MGYTEQMEKTKKYTPYVPICTDVCVCVCVCVGCVYIHIPHIHIHTTTPDSYIHKPTLTRTTHFFNQAFFSILQNEHKQDFIHVKTKTLDSHLEVYKKMKESLR